MKRASGDSNSHSAVHHPTLQREHVQKSPSHLYLKGNIWYFRYALPPKLRARFACSEIRLSLSTPYLSDARKYATALTSCLEDMLMPDRNLGINEIKTKLKEKYNFLFSYFNNNSIIILNKPTHETQDKTNNLSIDTLNISENNNTNYKYLEQNKFIEEKQLENLVHRYMEKVYKIPEKIIDAIYQSILKNITKENVLEYNEDIQMNKNISVYNSDKYKEFLIRDHDNKVIIDDFNNKKVTTKEDAQHLLLSELINKYIELKISDGKWTNENITTYKSRICTIIDILGDMPADSVTREMMRQYRDTLRKLPKQRKIRKEYRDKTIQDSFQAGGIRGAGGSGTGEGPWRAFRRQA